MSQSVRRVATTVVVAVSAALLTSGVANAESIWLVPGVDLGPVLGLTVQLPTQLLAPVVDLLTP
ncbi:hypothetical protein EIL87_13760 [Saccharopolyspora rhizosphaerae]|uniref:Secreted protein n=1 Tax=Saccharopolyspora rhizosphaerae TaxID=2492662 RepID=A0A426JSP8_9PSEU|nr:hypothetical protein [Saccharopolyspora rhizosphaerae]RRO16124.1 hypothetical protein EIL87_13760 [Saccharopolyspora rhizosphaerae]